MNTLLSPNDKKQVLNNQYKALTCEEMRNKYGATVHQK